MKLEAGGALNLSHVEPLDRPLPNLRISVT